MNAATTRRTFLASAGTAVLAASLDGRTMAAAAKPDAGTLLRSWYRLVLELVRHTPTYSPPVASRSFAYLGIAAYEAAAGQAGLLSLAGQVNGLAAVPARLAGQNYAEAVIIHATMAETVGALFANTGPTGQRVMGRFAESYRKKIIAGLDPATVAASEALGQVVARHILAWAESDGGAVIENMGFPMAYELSPGRAHWVPTNVSAQQQKPLLPRWGLNRTFAMPDGKACPLPPPPAYSEAKGSEFYREALEVYETARQLSPEQRAIARFWSDDPMLSPTPPGHWIAIALEILDQRQAEAGDSAVCLALLGIGLADAFIACWQSKFEFDLLRPVTYIRRVIDPSWEPLLNTPPFPEYPSGHSTQSAAAAAILAARFGEAFAFTDRTHERDGVSARVFPSFESAAQEAGISRLYGGIHFRAAIERGLDQGRCVAAHVARLRTRS
jgi:hypothetical protein